MNDAAIQAVIDTIAKDMVVLAQVIMEDDNISNNQKVNQNTLKNSILHKDADSIIKSRIGSNIVIDALFNHYVVYLENGRSPQKGKKPPIDQLKKWAANKGLPTDPNTLWAISYAIWRDGYAGRPILATFDKELEGLFLEDWSDKLYNSIIEVLDNFFNN